MQAEPETITPVSQPLIRPLSPLTSLPRRLLPDGRQRRYLLRALLMAVVLRLALCGVMYMVTRSIYGHGYPLAELIDQNMRRWDSIHYLHLAENGYTDHGDDRFLLVFFPFYPYLTGLVQGLLRNYMASALLISFAASVAAGWQLQALLHRHGFDEDHVFRAFMFFCCLPMAIYTVAPMTESLFLALTLWSFAAAGQGSWFRAGLAGALASATRSTGVLLLPALLLTAWLQRQAPDSGDGPARTPRRRSLRPLWLLLIPTGLAAYLYLNWKVTGDPLTFMRYQAEHWNQALIPPWEQLIRTLGHLSGDPAGKVRFNYYEPRLLAIFAGVALLIGGARRLPLPWQLYAWSSLLLFICAREAISLPRYLYVLFPIYPVLASWTRRPMVFQAALCLSTLLMAGWFVLFMTGNGAM